MATVLDLKGFINWFKETSPCADCGNFFPAAAMDFDHLPERGEKLGNIREFIVVADEQSLWLEISKCEIVCACCHRMRTNVRGPSDQARRNIQKAAKGRPKPQRYKFEWSRHHGHIRRPVKCSDGRRFESLKAASRLLKIPLTTLYRRALDGLVLKNGLTIRFEGTQDQ